MLIAALVLVSGATGGGVKGEYFRTVSDGVRAHLQHLMIYAGIRVDDPVADRTRKVQSWGILDRWRSRYGRQITFSDVGSKWAPADRGYAADIQSVANAFHNSYCRGPDPAPELLAAATGTGRASNSPARNRQQQPAASRSRRPPLSGHASAMTDAASSSLDATATSGASETSHNRG